jgi:hypothetical protein
MTIGRTVPNLYLNVRLLLDTLRDHTVNPIAAVQPSKAPTCYTKLRHVVVSQWD